MCEGTRIGGARSSRELQQHRARVPRRQADRVPRSPGEGAQTEGRLGICAVTVRTTERLRGSPGSGRQSSERLRGRAKSGREGPKRLRELAKFGRESS